MDVRGDEIDEADMGKRESNGGRSEEVYKGERERERDEEEVTF